MQTHEKYALIAILTGLILAGWLDGQDAQLRETVQVACIHCGEQP